VWLIDEGCFTDPANDTLMYEAAVDISQLIKVEDVMSSLTLGPNGGLMFCMEFLEKNVDWLLQQLSNYKDYYFLFDCPGQVSYNQYYNSISFFFYIYIYIYIYILKQYSVPISYTEETKKKSLA
jgi:hypothetical protein